MEADTWSQAIEAATAGMSAVGARERRRHARAFVDWCRIRGLAPVEMSREDVAQHVAEASEGKPKLAAKIRCSLRAVAKVVDADRAARVFGLGTQMDVLPISGPVAELIEGTIAQAPDRRAIRASALRRLFVWAAEVDVAPESLSPVDPPQFRAWLIELGIEPGEILVVARDFVDVCRRRAAGPRAGEPKHLAR